MKWLIEVELITDCFTNGPEFNEKQVQGLSNDIRNDEWPS